LRETNEIILVNLKAFSVLPIKYIKFLIKIGGGICGNRTVNDNCKYQRISFKINTNFMSSADSSILVIYVLISTTVAFLHPFMPARTIQDIVMYDDVNL
jgi:hypothetical protein